ncbi:MAG: Hsp70 family protein [Clostridia bacterium]|nr:Hsp70 family protein [Clostridia bacterium]
MRGLSLENIIAACHGDYFGPLEILRCEVTSVITDSRKAENGCLFAAIAGERVDGHDFIPAVMAAGALCCIGEKLPEKSIRPFIRVRDTVEALQMIAEFYRTRFDIPVIGITGSVGKTTAKEMVAAVLSRHYNVHKTAGNFNNDLGVPLTVFGLREEHTAAVIEMGISHFGDMSRLTRIVKPDYGLFTNIGHAHLEFLGDRAGVLKAKGEMLECLSRKGKIFCCGDDDMLAAADFGREKISYGLGENCLVRAENVRTEPDGSTVCTVVGMGRRFDVCINAYGEHMVAAALAGAAVGMELGLSDEEIKRMKDEAAANADADAIEKERIDKLNQADAMIFQTEKQMKEIGDKIPADKKSSIEGALAKLKDAHKSQDIAAIDTAIAELNTVLQSAAQDLYSAQAQQGGATGAQQQGPTADAPNNGGDDKVQDVDFEEVK